MNLITIIQYIYCILKPTRPTPTLVMIKSKRLDHLRVFSPLTCAPVSCPVFPRRTWTHRQLAGGTSGPHIRCPVSGGGRGWLSGPAVQSEPSLAAPPPPLAVAVDGPNIPHSWGFDSRGPRRRHETSRRHAHDTFEGHVRLFIKVFFKHSFKMFLKFVVLTRFKRRWCFLSQVWGTGWRVKGSSSGSRAK